MVAIHVQREPGGRWRELLFDGGLVVVTGVRPLAEFVEHARALLRDVLGTEDLHDAQEKLGSAELAGRIAAARAVIREDDRARALLREVLGAFGLDPARTYWDRLNLRIVPSGPPPAQAPDLVLGAHRDTWGSNVYAQVNWWLPLLDLTAERTVRFYPRHWTNPIPNTSAQWDLEELRRQRASGQPVTVPMVPAPLDPPGTAEAIEVVIQPGDVLLFSGAHLHATVPNSSGIPRFSVELRTVTLDDVLAGRGAPNVDGAAPHVPWGWFRSVEDRTPLSTVLEEPSGAAQPAQPATSAPRSAADPS